jgi:hypothetical protein
VQLGWSKHSVPLIGVATLEEAAPWRWKNQAQCDAARDAVYHGDLSSMMG